jgi:hypothetical protein
VVDAERALAAFGHRHQAGNGPTVPQDLDRLASFDDAQEFGQSGLGLVDADLEWRRVDHLGD